MKQSISKLKILKAELYHVEGIIDVCTKGWYSTYVGLRSQEYIDRVIKEYYNPERICSEILNTSENWYGWFVALENNQVVGAIGGGTTGENTGEIFVFYVDPSKRGEGIGTLLLNYFTEIQREKGIIDQWVSVEKGNLKGIPFYKAKGFKFISEKISNGSQEEENYISGRYHREIKV